MAIKSEVYEFFVEGKNPHLSHVLLHIASPGKPEGENQGYFFVLAELAHPEANILSVIEELIKDGETLYYGGYDGETKEAADPEAAHFESVIEKLNRRAKILLENSSEQKIHIAVGVISGNKLSFAYRGDILALLAYTSAEGPSFTRIVDEVSYPTAMFFSSVIEGNFGIEEAVYLSTPHIIKYFSCDRIAKMIIGKSSKHSAQQIQKTLEGISSDYSFGGLILTGIELIEPTKREKSFYKPLIGSEASMDRLIDTTRSTEDTLSPKVFSQLARSLTGTLKKNKAEDTEYEDEVKIQSKIRETSPGRYRRKRAEPNEGDSANSILIILGKILVWITKALFYVVKSILIGLGRLLAVIWSLTTNYNGNRKILIEQYRDSIRKIVGKVTGLGMFGKILLLTLIVGIAILSGSIVYTKTKAKEAAAETAYQSQMDGVDEKRKEAESYILYGESTKALESVRNAMNTLASLAHETPEKKTRADGLKSELDQLLLKVQKITKITPEKIVDIDGDDTEAHPDSIVVVGDKIMATGKNDTSLYLISTLTGTVEIKSAETAHELSDGYTAKDGSQVAFISGKNSIVVYDTASASIISKTIGYPAQGVVLADIALYNARLYALDSANGAIYRHNPTQVGYDNGTMWTKTVSDPNVLKDAVSFGIDGDLYVLNSKGRIIKLIAGDEQVFEIKGLDPALDSPTIIETNSEFNNLYILEPSRKRIIITDKVGNFKKQFTADEWTDLRGFAVSVDEKEAYILDGTVVYKFKL